MKENPGYELIVTLIVRLLARPVNSVFPRNYPAVSRERQGSTVCFPIIAFLLVLLAGAVQAASTDLGTGFDYFHQTTTRAYYIANPDVANPAEGGSPTGLSSISKLFPRGGAVYRTIFRIWDYGITEHIANREFSNPVSLAHTEQLQR